MKDFEQLLSHYDYILTWLEAGYSIKELVAEVNSRLHTSVTYRQLQYLIQMVKSNTIHKEYDNIAVIDGLKDSWDNNLEKYCIEFKGLLLTYKSATYLTNPEYIITPDNLLTIYDREAVLYAKRILKLYHISDSILLSKHMHNYPGGPNINLKDFTDKIYADFNDEFNTMLLQLRTKYLDFVENHLRELINAKEKSIQHGYNQSS